MKAPAVFVAGVLLAGAFTGSWSFRVLEASPVTAQTSRTLAVKTTRGPVRGDWRIGAPIVFEKLTIFPVISDQPTASNEFITLDGVALRESHDYRTWCERTLAED